MIRFLFFIVLVCFSERLWSQTASFSVKADACIGELIPLINTSTLTNTYNWDFCQDGLLYPENTVSAITTVPSNIPVGMEVVYDKGNWYGFVCSREGSANELIRIFFGTSLSNQSPTILPDFSPIVNSSLDGVSDIKLLYLNNQWYGFVVNYHSNEIVRIDFGTSLSNTTPGILSLGNPGSWNGIYGIDIIKSNGAIILAVTGNLSNTISFINYTTTIDSASPVVSAVTTLNSVDYPLIASPVKISLQQSASGWYALFSSLAGRIVQLNLGNDPMSIPAAITSVANISTASALQFKKDGNNYFAFVQNSTGSLFRLNFGSDMVNLPHVDPLGSLGGGGSVYGLALVKEWPEWKAFFVGVFSNNIQRLDFRDDCSTDVSSPYSNLDTPLNLSYLLPGDKVIELAAYDASNNVNITESHLTVQNLDAPKLGFSNSNNCFGQVNHFSAVEETGLALSNTSWDFGNGNTATGNTSSFQFPTVGSWPVIVRSTASTGCANLYSGLINIYNPPVASFSLPLASTLCTNQILAFTNTSNFDLESNPNWSWSINGVTASSSEDLNTTFNSTVTQSIQLIASISGCSSQATSPFAVQQQGPLVDFVLPPYGCQSTLLPLINTTSGAVTSYSWTFGDGNNSSLQNPSNTFSNPGAFSISLQATNAAGCQNSATKSITIYSKPQPDFSIGLPPFSCSESSSQFTDATPAPTDSNIASWTWGFGDAGNGSSILKNPTYTYSASGNYSVSLAVATNFGCTNSIQKPVTIAQSPVASYSNLPACANQLTQFTDTSTGSIKSRLWQMGINTFTTPNPQFTFSSSGAFPVTLTVTGNNNCVSQISKSINVPIPPSLDFSVEVPCTNSSTLFREITNSADPSISQSWAFGSLANGSGSPVQNIFASPGNYAVRLSSTRQSGCVYSTTKSVAIVNSPVADFSPSTDAGAAPLGVLFANMSTFSSSYLWKFKDSNSSTSTAVTPSFVFTDLGDYDVELTASNSVGCSSKANKIISVVVPRIDAVMTDFYFVKDALTNSLQPVVKVLNKSNVSIVDPSILIDVAGSSVVQKKIVGIVRPNQELTQMLDFQIVPRTNNYVCAEVQVTGDTDLFLNRKCLSLSTDEILFTPFPNPAQAELNLDWISVNGDPVDFQIVTRSGSVCLQQTVGTVVKGINRLVVNTSSLPAGIYYIRYRDSKLSKTFSFAVSGN